MDFEEQEDVYIAENEEGAVGDPFASKEEVLFLVDANREMFVENREGKLPFYMVSEAILGFYKDRIVAADSENLGIVLFNTQVTSNHMDFAGLHVLQELSPPDAPRIKQIQALVGNKDYALGHSESLLVEALWLAHDMLSQKQRTSYKRILLFTNEDRPNANRPNDMRRALQRAKDLNEQGIMLELFPFNKNNRDFDFQVFYSEIVVMDEEGPIVGYDGLEDLMSTIHKKEFRKRRLGTLDFMLAPNMKIAVSYYCMLKEMRKPVPVKLHAQTNKKLKTVTSWICQETGKPLWEHQLGYHYEIGGQKVIFTKEELKMVKDFDTPGLKLLGFKNSSKLKNYMNVRPSYFIYPEESRIKGSSSVVHSLLVSMQKTGKIAIVRILPRTGSFIKFGALLPSVAPPGFNLVFLPFADDMRSPESLRTPAVPAQIPDELVTSACEMIREIQLEDFSIQQFYNPAIQHFYSRLEALALELPTPSTIEDSLMPSEEGFKRHETAINQFFEAVGEVGNKRKPDRGNTQKNKKIKNETGEEYTEAELQKRKVDDLKDICDDLRIPKTGRKSELIEKILSKTKK